jgi:gamma-glutamylcyclotransferase (GGCT)/AIG2-like uncharacterized protein YtfP
LRYTQNLFSYGTLQDGEVQKTLLGRLLKGKPTVLLGYRMSEKKVHGKYPLIEISPIRADEVSGMLYKVSNFELHEIDQYESAAYKRVQLEVKSGTKAWAYVENLG